ncbi:MULTISPECIES: ABC transporter permease [Bacillus]|uniref:ABC transporter permease n=1 Tax=Bacillus TaxID=1386 RepID=UPI000B5D9E36|nr:MULTISPECIES: ABC transporter permease [Bacillus]OXB98815.1 ABC transporter permease [Bacillus sp. M13(2017)]QCY64305.1 ABC transporter permease [Bacillus thuringiensis]
MTFSMKRFSAIVRKEINDAGKNSQVILMALLPILLAVFYSNMDSIKEFFAGFIIVMTITMVGSYVQAIIIAEEKEKHTLRVLMLSPASPIEVILGKSVLTVFFVLASSFISLVILDTFKGNIGMLVIIILIGTLLCVVLGTIVGLLSQNIAQTSIVGLPIFLIFIMGPMLKEMVKNEFIIKVVNLLPTNHVMEALQKVIKGEGLIAIQEHILNNTIWTICLIILCIIVYKKKQLD